ncbi:MAG: hypothetical protein M1831_005336 [Alyxoria varia]|nr:MAG: hypothetical protein M1831_005336 [Alyxoria varia]
MAENSNELSYHVVDVFTSTKFVGGNPLAIVHVPASWTLCRDEKLNISREFNLSETVFLHESVAQDESTRKMDIFIPSGELPLAGHPVIGTAWLLGELHPHWEKATLITKAGEVYVSYDRQNQTASAHRHDASAVLPCNFHIQSARLEHQQLNRMQPTLASKLDDKSTTWPVASLAKSMAFVLVDVGSMEMLEVVQQSPVIPPVELDEEWQPSIEIASYFYYIEPVGSTGENEIIHTRMIHHDVGEDAATGIAACTLSCYLLTQGLQGNGGKVERQFEVRQGEHMDRRSTMRVSVVGERDAGVSKIELKGSAVKVMTGVLHV